MDIDVDNIAKTQRDSQRTQKVQKEETTSDVQNTLRNTTQKTASTPDGGNTVPEWGGTIATQTGTENAELPRAGSPAGMAVPSTGSPAGTSVNSMGASDDWKRATQLLNIDEILANHGATLIGTHNIRRCQTMIHK